MTAKHEVEHRFFHSGGVRLHYVLAGSGPSVILLHGFPETHRSFQLQIPALVAAGYRVAALDLRGYGRSERPEGAYDLDTLASDVAALADELGSERVRLVGHDWGGAITWHFAATRPWRLARAVVIDCPPAAVLARALLENPRQVRRSWYIFFFQLPLLPELWLRAGGGAALARMFRELPAPAAIGDAQLPELLEPGAVRAALAYYRTAFRKSLRDPLGRRQRFRPVPLPLTLIWGENDACLGTELIPECERFAPDLSVHVVPGAGHFVHQERPEVVNELLVGALGGTMPPGGATT